MVASITSAESVVDVCVGVTLTPADVKVIERALRSEVVAECAEILTGPLPRREEILRIRTMIDTYAEQFGMLEGGDPRADIEMDCQMSELDSVALDLLDRGEDRTQDHRVAVCAVLEHMLTEFRGRLEN